MYVLYVDGEGKPFPDGNKRYVVFADECLVGEFHTLRQADEAYLKKIRVPGGIRRSKYKGIPDGGNHVV